MLVSRSLRGACALAALAAAPWAAHAAPVTGGVYQMHNHPDGAALPPAYGLRLDELYNATSGHDIFTFDFDHPQSNMQLTFDPETQRIVITGVTFGGRDVGSAYANDAYRGLYTVYMEYNGAVTVPGDDDVWVPGAGGSNSGTIQTPLGHTKALTDLGMDGYSLRIGDEDNDLGHRGFAGTSGWGWLNVDGVHENSMDWLFTLGPIPEPSSAILLALGATAILRRRR